MNFRKHRSRKKIRFSEVKMAKPIKTEKTEELIAGYQEVESLWNVLSLSCKDKNVKQMALKNLTKMAFLKSKQNP